MRQKLLTPVAGLILVMIGVVYWPVVHADFIWIDWTDFVQMPWLRHGDEWKHYVLRDFNGWANYFRPLVVAFYTLQIRLFNDTPGPMHGVSLGLHLLNTALVGALAWRMRPSDLASTWRSGALWGPMLIYGLHPVLIEPVAWINCQFELVLTFFVLLGLWLNRVIAHAGLRALVVGVVFFLAACTKESAISFPLLLLLFDWLALRDIADTPSTRLLSLARRDGLAILSIVVAGLAYLSFRHWALGHLVNPFEPSKASLLSRAQEVAYIYMQYWRMLLWPMQHMSIIHPVDVTQFEALTIASLAIDIAAIALLLYGLYSTLKKASAAGGIVLTITACLLPILHIASTDFDYSLYHERYIMTALAVSCTLIPLLQFRLPAPFAASRLLRPFYVFIALAAVVMAVANIRSTLPLWSNDFALWRWVAIEHPRDAAGAKSNLISAYIRINNFPQAQAIIDGMGESIHECPECMLEAAFIAIKRVDLSRAATILEAVRHEPRLARDPLLYESYLSLTGEMLILKNNLDDAVQVLNASVKLNPDDPDAWLYLAIALALRGDIDNAHATETRALELSEPAYRSTREKSIQIAIASGRQTHH